MQLSIGIFKRKKKLCMLLFTGLSFLKLKISEAHREIQIMLNTINLDFNLDNTLNFSFNCSIFFLNIRVCAVKKRHIILNLCYKEHTEQENILFWNIMQKFIYLTMYKHTFLWHRQQ